MIVKLLSSSSSSLPTTMGAAAADREEVGPLEEEVALNSALCEDGRYAWELEDQSRICVSFPNVDGLERLGPGGDSSVRSITTSSVQLIVVSRSNDPGVCDAMVVVKVAKEWKGSVGSTTRTQLCASNVNSGSGRFRSPQSLFWTEDAAHKAFVQMNRWVGPTGLSFTRSDMRHRRRNFLDIVENTKSAFPCWCMGPKSDWFRC